jgi:hypothetical protein
VPALGVVPPPQASTAEVKAEKKQTQDALDREKQVNDDLLRALDREQRALYFRRIDLAAREAGSGQAWRHTDARAVEAGTSTNIYVAGMLPDTTYEMRHVFSDGTGSTPVTFTTGSIPATLSLPTFNTAQPPGPGSDTDQGLVFHSLIGPSSAD